MGEDFLVVHWLKIHLTMEGTWFDTWSRMIPPALEQLSPRATTIEMLLGLCSTGEVTGTEKPPCAKTREKPEYSNQTQHGQSV